MAKLQRKEAFISTESVSNNGIYGGLITSQYPDPCYRCKGTVFHICKDGDDMIAFCANDKCLQEDCAASKAEAQKEYALRIERNERGVVVTGAEKFRMGSEYKNACLARWIAPAQYQKVVSEWTKDNHPFLVVMGSPGTGKTYLSAAMLNLLFEMNEEVFYTTHRRFIEEIHRGMEEGKTQHSVIDKLSYKKFLIIDDLAAATCTEWQKEMILELIDRRYSDKSKTLITTNLSPKNLGEYLGERTASRLMDQKNSTLQIWTEDNRKNPQFYEGH